MVDVACFPQKLALIRLTFYRKPRFIDDVDDGRLRQDISSATTVEQS